MKPSFLELLKALAAHDVEMIVVGGIAALIEGAPIATLDLDVVYAVGRDNPDRLVRALEGLDGRYRDPAGHDISPTAERLRSHQTSLMATRYGPLDLLQSIGKGWSYAELLPDAPARDIGGIAVRVLNLAKVIEAKRVANRPKDRAVLAVLEETLKMKLEGKDGDGS